MLCYFGGRAARSGLGNQAQDRLLRGRPGALRAQRGILFSVVRGQVLSSQPCRFVCVSIPAGADLTAHLDAVGGAWKA